MTMRIGVKSLYYAPLTNDTSSGVSYGTPAAIPGLNKIGLTRKSSRDNFYADDGPWDTATAKDVYEVELTVADIPLALYNTLMGITQVGAEGRPTMNDVAPFVAIGFQATKSNGNSRYYWLYKGQFSPADEENESKGATAKLKPILIKATFLGHTFDRSQERILDADDPNYLAVMGTAFFSSVLPTADSTPPTITNILPANNATGVAVGSTVSWTFSEAINVTGLTAGNFLLVKDIDGSNVAGTLAINATKTVVNFTPSANLTAAAVYRAIVTTDVTDMSGNKLASPSVTKFTC